MDDETKDLTAGDVWGDENDTDVPAWKRGLKGSQEEFVVQVNTALYWLILGIVDDLLANTELVLMTDRIHFDIIPRAIE